MFLNHGGRSPNLCNETYILDFWLLIFGCDFLSDVFWERVTLRFLAVVLIISKCHAFLEFPRSLGTVQKPNLSSARPKNCKHN